MPTKIKESAKDLTDEEVLKEFVQRFQCDGAILIYMDGDYEHGFQRWRNKAGKVWTEQVIDAIKNRER